MREQWDSASGNFDRLYGLARAWEEKIGEGKLHDFLSPSYGTEASKEEELKNVLTKKEIYTVCLNEIHDLLDKDFGTPMSDEMEKYLKEREKKLERLIDSYNKAAESLRGNNLTVVTKLVDAIKEFETLKVESADTQKSEDNTSSQNEKG